MARSAKSLKPTDAELEILRVLWERGPSTVREVQEALSRGKPTGYTTALKLMQIMVEKELLRRNESNRAHVYRVAAPRGRTLRRLAKDMLERAFGGSAVGLVLHALESRDVSPEDIAKIRELLDDYESRAGGETLTDSERGGK